MTYYPDLHYFDIAIRHSDTLRTLYWDLLHHGHLSLAMCPLDPIRTPYQGAQDYSRPRGDFESNLRGLLLGCITVLCINEVKGEVPNGNSTVSAFDQSY